MEFEHNYGGIKGLVVITPAVFGDERGFFKETFNEKEFKENSIDIHWVQANHSRSSKGVLRGLHWQKEPHAQDKLVRATTGSVLDVAVDIRKRIHRTIHIHRRRKYSKKCTNRKQHTNG